jgi:hypothetical protein
VVGYESKGSQAASTALDSCTGSWKYAFTGCPLGEFREEVSPPRRAGEPPPRDARTSCVCSFRDEVRGSLAYVQLAFLLRHRVHWGVRRSQACFALAQASQDLRRVRIVARALEPLWEPLSPCMHHNMLTQALAPGVRREYGLEPRPEELAKGKRNGEQPWEFIMGSRGLKY